MSPDPDNPHIEELIVSRSECRGKGTDADPCRRVLQVFRKDGKLLCENDPVMERRVEEEKAAAEEKIPF